MAYPTIRELLEAWLPEIGIDNDSTESEAIIAVWEGAETPDVAAMVQRTS